MVAAVTVELVTVEPVPVGSVVVYWGDDVITVGTVVAVSVVAAVAVSGKLQRGNICYLAMNILELIMHRFQFKYGEATQKPMQPVVMGLKDQH